MRLKKGALFGKLDDLWWKKNNMDQAWRPRSALHEKLMMTFISKINLLVFAKFFSRLRHWISGFGAATAIIQCVWTNCAVSSSIDGCYNSFRRQRQLYNWFKRTVILGWEPILHRFDRNSMALAGKEMMGHSSWVYKVNAAMYNFVLSCLSVDQTLLSFDHRSWSTFQTFPNSVVWGILS